MFVMSIITGGKPCQEKKETLEDILDRMEQDIETIREKLDQEVEDDDDSFDDEDEE
jgi:hypothetical protein